jgi:hypothetical protein
LDKNSHLNFHVEITDLEKTSDFYDLSRAFFTDRSELRGFVELLDEIEELKSDESLTNSTLFTAYSDEALCGCAWAYIKDSVIKIPVFVVDAKFREIGVGDYLFNKILNTDFFDEATTFESQVLPGDRHSKNFFEQHAGKTRKLTVQGIISDAKTEQ